jgi:hypothetical protein
MIGLRRRGRYLFDRRVDEACDLIALPRFSKLALRPAWSERVVDERMRERLLEIRCLPGVPPDGYGPSRPRFLVCGAQRPIKRCTIL